MESGIANYLDRNLSDWTVLVDIRVTDASQPVRQTGVNFQFLNTFSHCGTEIRNDKRKYTFFQVEKKVSRLRNFSHVFNEENGLGPMENGSG